MSVSLTEQRQIYNKEILKLITEYFNDPKNYDTRFTQGLYNLGIVSCEEDTYNVESIDTYTKIMETK